MAAFIYSTPPTLQLQNSLPGLLNQRLASSNRPGSRFTATIFPHDSQSFTTDISQTWLTSPQSPRLPPPASNTINFSNQDSDFVLFPSTAATHPRTAQARENSELAQATSRTVPNQHLGSTYNGQQTRQNSTQQFSSSASPIQNPRVSGIIQRSPSTSPSTQYSPIGQQTHFYANSAPSSTAGLHHQSPRSRPPVPLFHSTGEVPQSNMAHSDLFEGSSFLGETRSLSPGLTSSPDCSDTMFNFSEFTSASDPHSDGLYESLNNFTTHFEAINDPAPGQASTVSPKDIMVDSMSAPPSGAFTDLTTPGTSTWESPYTANSCQTSPLFMDNLSPDDDPDKWPSLFGEIQEPEREASVSDSIAGPETTPVAPKMSRNDSSPGQTSSRSSHQGRHSFTAGVAPKRRDKPLPAITVEDPTDTVAVKRARNTLAARKSREKRMERTEALANQVNELEAEVEHWKSIALGMGHRE